MSFISTPRRWVPIAALFLLIVGLTHIDTDSRAHYTQWTTVKTASLSYPAPLSSDDLARVAALKALVALPDDPVAFAIDRNKDLAWRDVYTAYNSAKLSELAVCNARGDCHPNANKVILYMSTWCIQAIFEYFLGGEGIWCRGMIGSLERQGYTVLYTNNEGSENFVKKLYQQIPDLIKIIVNDDGFEGDRNLDHRPFYQKTPTQPDGIPLWKMFTFRYFGGVHPSKVGDRWSIAAEPQWREKDTPWFENYTYIGYDIPKVTGGTPSSERPYRVWVYGKRSVYFDASEAEKTAWPMEWFERARKELVQDYPGFEFVGSIKVENVKHSKDQYYIDKYVNKGMDEVPCPEGIRNLGTLLPKAQFDHELSQVRVMLGIGDPLTSPSPYFALANGVSFINPHKRGHNKNKQDDYREWARVQHSTLRTLSEPYVYNVEAEGDYSLFIGALRRALDNPIEPYVSEYHETEGLDERVREWMETDWEAEAQRILDLRKQGIETQKTREAAVFEM